MSIDTTFSILVHFIERFLNECPSLSSENKMYELQVEFYKIVGMVSNNHHIKHNKNGHFLVSPAPKQVTNFADFNMHF